MQPRRLGLTLYELITNSVQHAFESPEGVVLVELAKVGRNFRCPVTDNGTARLRPGSGRGLGIVNALARELGGVFIQTCPSRGTVSTLTFPDGSPSL